MPPPTSNRSLGWMGLHRGHRANPLEWMAEKLIFAISLSSILMVFLIFVFIGREALPVLLGKVDTSRLQKALPVEEMNKLRPAELREYLGLTEAQLASMDRETIKTLMELKLEAAGQTSQDADASANTARWRYLLQP